MKLYDEVIKECCDLLSDAKARSMPVSEGTWGKVDDRSMILRSDMAYELGSGNLPAVGMTLITDSAEFAAEDSLTLIGSDLPEITGDCGFARIAILRMEPGILKEGDTLYKAVRDLEYTRYHFYPEGFMMRVSASKAKETVRVSKEALQKGLTFEKTGSQMIEAFHNYPGVKAVCLTYVTDPDFAFGKLQALQKQAEAITKAIDHIGNGAIMDCVACNLQEVCNEVEGLRELHFSH